MKGIQEAEVDPNLPSAEVTNNGTPVPNTTVKLSDSTSLPFKPTLADSISTVVTAGEYPVKEKLEQ